MKRSAGAPLTICRASVLEPPKLKRTSPPPPARYARATASSTSVRLVAAETVIGARAAAPCEASVHRSSTAIVRKRVIMLYSLLRIYLDCMAIQVDSNGRGTPHAARRGPPPRRQLSDDQAVDLQGHPAHAADRGRPSPHP